MGKTREDESRRDALHAHADGKVRTCTCEQVHRKVSVLSLASSFSLGAAQSVDIGDTKLIRGPRKIDRLEN